MTQTNSSTKQKQTHRHRQQSCGCQGGGGVGEGRTESLVGGLVEGEGISKQINGRKTKDLLNDQTQQLSRNWGPSLNSGLNTLGGKTTSGAITWATSKNCAKFLLGRIVCPPNPKTLLQVYKVRATLQSATSRNQSSHCTFRSHLVRNMSKWCPLRCLMTYFKLSH